jgi:hypothetical protein
MGMYTIPCPVCGDGFYWFCGNQDQRCPRCRGVRLMTREECAAMDRALADSQTVVHEGIDATSESTGRDEAKP